MTFTINTDKILQFLSRYMRGTAMTIATRLVETAHKLAPDTPEGRILRATLSTYLMRKELIEKGWTDHKHKTIRLADEARFYQNTLRLMKRGTK